MMCNNYSHFLVEQLLKDLLDILDVSFTIATNQSLLQCLSRFRIEHFNQVLIESLYDEKINRFLERISKMEDDDYKNEVLTFHAEIFLTEANKELLRSQGKLDVKDMERIKAQEEQEKVILFEHFNDEVGEELTFVRQTHVSLYEYSFVKSGLMSPKASRHNSDDNSNYQSGGHYGGNPRLCRQPST